MPAAIHLYSTDSGSGKVKPCPNCSMNTESVRMRVETTRRTSKVSAGRYRVPQPSTVLYRHCCWVKLNTPGTSSVKVLNELSLSP